MNNNLRISIRGSVVLMLLFLLGCTEGNKIENTELLFPKGNLVPKENFTGKAWNLGLVGNDSIYTTVVGAVTFEAGSRTNWHSHPSGQILVITDGVGFHQIKGESKQILKKGEVVRCPPNVTHWHGASPNQSMSHMYILPNTEHGIVNWMEPITDDEYKSK